MALTSNNRGGSLNEHQRRRLFVTSRYIDKLLSDVEEILNASASKSPFGRWRDDTSPVQRKVAQDYISRIRSQLVRVLESQDIVNPGPTVGSIHAIRTTLNFIDIAVEELKPKYMRGYGEVPEAVIPELNGIVNELAEVVRKLNFYLAQGLGQDLQGRLEKLDQAEDDIALLKTIERVIRDHGLVEFRPTLSIILQRLEEERFEIAFFGRVSAGKSSLLNYILQSEALPVGVNPITAVPTRIVYGPRPKLTVRFANNKTSTFEIKQLAEFATEQQNSANAKHVARISVELPSPRLRSGVVLVDTPGLGSLASAGAAETAAYLPRCDLGVVLIDAGSTLTQEDLSTIQALYEASIPALILLSKADLLAPEDRVQALKYIEDHVHSQLGLDLSAHAVSILGDHANLSDRWFEQEIVSLYGRHQQLAKQSIKRKVAALGEAVDTALRLKLEKTPRNSGGTTDDLRKVEGELRRAGGSIEEVRQARWLVLREFYSLAEAALVSAAADVVKQWSSISEGKNSLDSVVRSAVTRVAAERARTLYELLVSLERHLSEALDATAKDLNVSDAAKEEKTDRALSEMPQLDLGTIQLDLHFSFLLALGEGIAKRRVEKELKRQIGPAISDSLSAYGKQVEAWTTRTLEELLRRFGARADWYRAHIERLAGGKEISGEEEKSIRLDLEQLARPAKAELVMSEIVSVE